MFICFFLLLLDVLSLVTWLVLCLSPAFMGSCLRWLKDDKLEGRQLGGIFLLSSPVDFLENLYFVLRHSFAPNITSFHFFEVTCILIYNYLHGLFFALTAFSVT